MCDLDATLAALRTEDLAALSDEAAESRFEELERGARVLQAEIARRLADVERRGIHGRRGHVSVTAWVADRFQLGWSDATRRVETSRALRAMPVTRRSLSEGALSESAVQMLVRARESSPEEFDAAESQLVAAARTLPAKGLRREIARWRAATQDDDGSRLFARRRLAVWPTVYGMVRVDGELDPETGQTLITALASAAGASAADDERTADQRRADALADVCRGFLGGSSPSRRISDVVVTVDIESLLGANGARAWFDDAGVASVELARKLACDASVIRVITRGAREVLDVGRKTAVVSAALRRALIVRDGGCAAPGCDRPPGWTDAHHVRHWVDGGPTSLDNLVLLCRRHHGMVHDRSLAVAILDRRPVFYASDGERLERRGPPVPALTA